MQILKTGLCATLLTMVISTSTFAQSMEVCDPSWPVVLTERSPYGSKELAIRVTSGLIANEDKTADVFLTIATQYSPWAELRGDVLMGSFINKEKHEQWLPLAKIEKTEVYNGKATCHKLVLAEGVTARETVESFRPECFPLPKWMCGSKRTSFIEFNVKQQPGYYLKTSMSVTHR